MNGERTRKERKLKKEGREHARAVRRKWQVERDPPNCFHSPRGNRTCRCILIRTLKFSSPPFYFSVYLNIHVLQETLSTKQPTKIISQEFRHHSFSICRNDVFFFFSLSSKYYSTRHHVSALCRTTKCWMSPDRIRIAIREKSLGRGALFKVCWSSWEVEGSRWQTRIRQFLS